MLGLFPYPLPSLGSMAISPPAVHMQTQRVSLSLSLRCAEGALCLLQQGIVSLSQLSDQVATVNGHGIKATSLKKRVYPHMHLLSPFYDRILSPWRQ